jgi:ribosomal protein L11 methyltransferase
MWLSVAIATDAGHAEALSDALLALGALSVGVEDADAGTERETPQFGEPGSTPGPLWAHSRVIALFDKDADIPLIAAAAAGEAGLSATPPYDVAEVAEQDWVRLTQSQFQPIRVNARLWIVPSWHEAPDPDAVNLVLDPGLAFGTGSHPTTRLCLEWLCAHLPPGASVLDYGCGSGILAIAAAKLGVVASASTSTRTPWLQLPTTPGRMAQSFSSCIPRTRWTCPSHRGGQHTTNPLCVLALLAERTRPGGRSHSPASCPRRWNTFGKLIDRFDLTVWAEREGWSLWRACDMMLTCCPTCSTAFRVTPEQLKARAGKVRCGPLQCGVQRTETWKTCRLPSRPRKQSPPPEPSRRRPPDASLRTVPR